MKGRRFSLLSILLAAVFIAATGTVLFRTEQVSTGSSLSKLASDPDAALSPTGGNAMTLAGINNEADRGPSTIEEEKYANRAYPANGVPFALTEQAQAAYQQIKGRAKNKAGTWSLYGPSQATVPATLSVYGGNNAKYVTAGRTTSLAIDPNCSQSKCRLWIGAAGGGVWRTNNALSSNPNWEFISISFVTNAIGTITLDPTDASGNTIYVGTGEANASGDSVAGRGIYKSTNGGNTWTRLNAQTTINGQTIGAFNDRAIGAIAIDPRNPSVIYVSTTRGVRGYASVTGGAVSLVPGAAPWGLYKSTDGGATFNLIWDGNASVRGVRRVELDPINPDVVYAAAYQQGLWRSNNGGQNWEQIYYPVAPGSGSNRTEFDVTLKDGATRIYVADGAQGAPYSRVFRADSVNTKNASVLLGANNNAGWVSLTSDSLVDPRYGSYNYCTGQCWYDNYIATPPGHPDIVYLGGSHQYGETYGISNGRGVVLSTDAGASWTDMTVEGGTTSNTINLHPDHHFLVTHPADPFTFFSASDGGVVRSNGKFSDTSALCDTRGLNQSELGACKRLLSRVPERLISLNTGLSTLQFQSLAADPTNYRNLIGGTQDNGTWQNNGSSGNWEESIYGDGGQAGFSIGNPKFRFNTFTGKSIDANFRNGDPRAWVVISGPLYGSPESAAFYPPFISDPVVPGTLFFGAQSVWRTKNYGGDQAYLEANCPEFSTFANTPGCGDWVRLGGNTLLTSGPTSDRGGGTMAAVERGESDTATLWAATSTGRLFVSKNADAEPASSVTFTRIDTLAPNDPPRFISSIYVDPANPNRAFVSYSGYSATVAPPNSEPNQPGHVFEVVFNPAMGTATWTSLDTPSGGPLGDLPVTDLVFDKVTGDLYASTDFGVHLLKSGSNAWTDAGQGLPMVEVAGLTIVPGDRVLYAATHGRSAWKLTLP